MAIAGSVEFAVMWPEARERVETVLRSRGAQASDADDVAQEVAIRALNRPEPFASREHFLRWCCRVAINLHIDGVRRGRLLSAEPLPEAAGPVDTATTAERRMALDAVLDGVAALSDDDRDALFDATPAESRRDAVRLAVRRHRIRTRLAALMEGMATLVALLRRLARQLSPVARAGIVAAPILAVGLTLEPFASGPVMPAPRPSASSPAAVAGAARPVERAAASHRVASPAVAVAKAVRDRVPPASSRGSFTSPPTTLVYGTRAGPGVTVSKETHPQDDPRVCVFGHVNVCVRRPGPAAPDPTAIAPH